ncbi:ACT domain-containing protein [Clostridium sp. MB40-C1]|uniref:ACT domain-containing protein n=1 Tax=Clostridium sp. MB40-C1 TaxID=3070996 RepID=UPI0027DEF335|nr:ACT domain-containing protein [Clostridium sp. MB40-C1]WMJ79096.1 ACT domain-containing protein [Clostridium sp. MB40-C1]
MKSIITVLGKDKTGIIASISSVLAESNVNILDISQTILQEYFTMIMLVDLSKATKNFNELKDILASKGMDMGLSVKIQHEDIFNSMHNI